MTTRRDIVKSGAVLAAIIATGRAPAALIRSMAAARFAIAKASGPRLPYDAEVEYIETDGVASYIDTGVLVDWWNEDHGAKVPGSTVQVTFQFPSIPPVESGYGPCVCGARYRSGATWTMFCIAAQHTSSYSRIVTRIPNLLANTPLTPIDTSVHNVIMGGNVTIDGVEYAQSSAYSSITVRFMLGCSGDPSLWPIDSSTFHAANARIYYVKILDGQGNVKFDAIPVRKDGSGYLYDRISGRMLGNSGSGGTITAGPERARARSFTATTSRRMNCGTSAIWTCSKCGGVE